MIENNTDNKEIGKEWPRLVLLNGKQWLYIQRRYHMTPREVQIVKLVCQGLSNKDIAIQLNISSGTIKAHIRNIYRKSWVHTRIGMLLRFLEDVKAASQGRERNSYAGMNDRASSEQ